MYAIAYPVGTIIDVGKAMDNKYMLATLEMRDKTMANKYAPARKRMYFIAEGEEEVREYIKANSIDGGGVYNVAIEPATEEDLKGTYPTDGFISIVRVVDDLLGRIDIRPREFLVEWYKREHDGEYARVMRRENFIVTARDGKTAGNMANDYAINHRFAYADDTTFYTITDFDAEIERIKESGKFFRV